MEHKPNLANNPNPINPKKSEIGKISKQILDRIDKAIITAFSLNQWKIPPSWIGSARSKIRTSIRLPPSMWSIFTHPYPLIS